MRVPVCKQPALRADHRLGRRRRARREDQRPRDSTSGSSPRSSDDCGQRASTSKIVTRPPSTGGSCAGDAGSSSGKWRGSVTIKPDVRVLDVAPQVLVAAGVVEPDDHRAGERGAAEREQVVGHVVEQDTDVQNAIGRARRLCEEQVGPADRLGQELGVRPSTDRSKRTAGRGAVAGRCRSVATTRRRWRPAAPRAWRGSIGRPRKAQLVPDSPDLTLASGPVTSLPCPRRRPRPRDAVASRRSGERA